MFKDEVSSNKSYTKTMVGDDVELDQIAINVIRNDCPDFLLPMKITGIDG